MSSGKFKRSRYTSSKTGLIHSIRVQPETETLVVGTAQNTPTGAEINGRPAARVSGSRRCRGILYARMVSLQFIPGAAPAGYVDQGVVTVPWLNADTFNGIATGQSCEYLGATAEVVGTREEVYR